MPTAELAHETDFDGWRRAARAFRMAGVPPAEARFRVAGSEGSDDLFGENDLSVVANGEGAPFSAPRAFVDLAEGVICHRSEDRFDLMYRLLWRLKTEPDLMAVLFDPLVADARLRAKTVSRASHKMKAFVRFREAEDAAGACWVAWFEPAHRVLERTAPFFARRFATMRWSILTPDGAAHWDSEALTFGPPATRDQAPAEDEVEEFWRTYYTSTFNPARLRTQAMQSEMPKRYWKNLPEAALIPEMIAAAERRSNEMVARPSPQPNARFVRALAPDAPSPTDLTAPAPGDLNTLRDQVQGCRRCPLWRDATHGVCGEGPRQADLMVVGEQPGDPEDLADRPFVGPAGAVLDGALAEAGIDRASVFVTNAVRHFKHEVRGKRRLHKTPNAGEVKACRWWLDTERKLVRPKVVVALGATAALAVLGRKVSVLSERGQALAADDGTSVVVTVHPAYLLRVPDPAVRAAGRRDMIRDLRLAAAQIRS